MKDKLTPKQAAFLCYEGREALFGGAAGGGKSVALLLAALQFVEVPGYAALILRRTFAQLSKADSILGKALEWLLPLRPRGVRYNASEHKFTFPSGATLEFGHMQSEADKFNYQGGIWAFIGADECTQFTGPMLSYPRTRMRRPAGSRVPMRWRGASNPGGVGHDYIKARYVRTPEGRDPCGPDRQFFPAKIDDNPNIDRAEYVAQLRESGIDRLTLEQLLNGDWDAVAGGRFRREWFGRWRRDPHSPDFVLAWPGAGIDEEPERFQWRGRPIFQTCDPAASASTAADYFVLSTWLLSPKGRLLWWDCERGKFELPEQVSLCQRSYARHKPQFVCVEEVLNQRGLAQLLRRSTSPAMVVRGVSPNGKKKLEHALGAIVLASDGRLLLPEDSPLFPLEDVVAELTRFTGDDTQDANDDCVDCVAYACSDALPLLGPPQGGRAPGMYLPKALR